MATPSTPSTPTTPFTPTPVDLEQAYADAHRREQLAYAELHALRDKRFKQLLTFYDARDTAVRQDDQMARWIAEGVIKLPGSLREGRVYQVTKGLPDPRLKELLFGNQRDLARQEKILRRQVEEAQEVWLRARADLRAARAARGY